jgi:hypothetical protein
VIVLGPQIRKQRSDTCQQDVQQADGRVFVTTEDKALK